MACDVWYRHNVQTDRAADMLGNSWIVRKVQLFSYFGRGLFPYVSVLSHCTHWCAVLYTAYPLCFYCCVLPWKKTVGGLSNAGGEGCVSVCVLCSLSLLELPCTSLWVPRWHNKWEESSLCSLTWHFTAINTAYLSVLKIQHQKAFQPFTHMCDGECVCESARVSFSISEQVITSIWWM